MYYIANLLSHYVLYTKHLFIIISTTKRSFFYYSSSFFLKPKVFLVNSSKMYGNTQNGFWVVLLFLIYCFMYLPLFVGVMCWSLFWYELLCVLSSFASILARKRERVDLLYCLSYALSLLMFCGSSSRCPVLVCSV